MQADKLFNTISFNSLPLPHTHTLTLPLTPRVHSDLDGEGGVLRLVVMDDNHIGAWEGNLGSETDLRLGKKKREEA